LSFFGFVWHPVFLPDARPIIMPMKNSILHISVVIMLIAGIGSKNISQKQDRKISFCISPIPAPSVF
jgi:hypothetical protein